MDHAQLRSVLGDALFALVGDLPSAVVQVDPLVGNGPCSSFRLVLADGTVRKVKRLQSADAAARVEHLLCRLAHAAFPTVLARRGAAILTQWVAGRSLDRTESNPDLLRTCGGIHALIHDRSAPEELVPAEARRPEPHAERLRRELDVLVAAGRIAPAEAAEALAVADRHAPTDCTAGIIHDDFSAENVVCTEAGDVVVVDNETLSIGAHAYDLARTWYRWPMNAIQRAAYLEGYRRQRSTDELDRHFPFWAVVVLVRGAAFRLRTSRPGIAEPIALLRAQLERRR